MFNIIRKNPVNVWNIKPKFGILKLIVQGSPIKAYNVCIMYLNYC